MISSKVRGRDRKFLKFTVQISWDTQKKRKYFKQDEGEDQQLKLSYTHTNEQYPNHLGFGKIQKVSIYFKCKNLCKVLVDYLNMKNLSYSCNPLQIWNDINMNSLNFHVFVSTAVQFL